MITKFYPGFFIIDDHAIELTLGQVVTYRSTSVVTICSDRADLIAKYREQFPEQANIQYPQELSIPYLTRPPLRAFAVVRGLLENINKREK